VAVTLRKKQAAERNALARRPQACVAQVRRHALRRKPDSRSCGLSRHSVWKTLHSPVILLANRRLRDNPIVVSAVFPLRILC
jgi:hypothetical protein